MDSIDESVDLEVPVSRAYQRWTEFTTFPEYMDSVEEVREFDGAHSHWVTSLGGFVREFDATIVEQQPGRRIAWTCEPGPLKAGSITFEPVGDSSSRVSAHLDLDPQGLLENFADKAGILHRMVVADMYRFKKTVESVEDSAQA